MLQHSKEIPNDYFTWLEISRDNYEEIISKKIFNHVENSEVHILNPLTGLYENKMFNSQNQSE